MVTPMHGMIVYVLLKQRCHVSTFNGHNVPCVETQGQTEDVFCLDVDIVPLFHLLVSCVHFSLVGFVSVMGPSGLNFPVLHASQIVWSSLYEFRLR